MMKFKMDPSGHTFLYYCWDFDISKIRSPHIVTWVINKHLL